MRHWRKACAASVIAGLLALGTSSASALTYEGAVYRSLEVATAWWGPGEESNGCTGPFENVKGKTQYACYGKKVDSCYKWQINLDPYGTVTYHLFGCPTLRADGSPPSGAPTATE